MSNRLDLRPASVGQRAAEETLERPQVQAQPAALFEPEGDIAIEFERLSLWYGKKQALTNVSLKIPAKKITALIGPSGCGKSTLLRCINRMNDLIPSVRIEGAVY